ncbi:MAG: N-acetyltransferase [Flavisolibacter sp.]
MNLSLRPATVADAELIAQISHITFHETFAKDNTKTNMDKFFKDQFSKKKLMGEVALKENTFLLAYHSKQIAGYVKLKEGQAPKELSTPGAIEIGRLYAMKKYIGKGVGKLLMNASLTKARQLNKKVIWLGVWEKNDRAIRFYQNWGFEKFADSVFLLGNEVQNDWLMKKLL